MKALLEGTREKLQMLSGDARDASPPHSKDVNRVDSLCPNPPPKSGKRIGGRVYSRNTVQHPSMLDEINDLISSGLKRLEKERLKCIELKLQSPEYQNEIFPETEQNKQSENSYQSDRLMVYRAAFQKYMGGSSLYLPFLTSFIDEYDGALDSLRQQVRDLSSVRLELPTQQSEAANRLREVNAEHEQHCEELLRRISQLEGSVAASERRLAITKAEFQEYKDSSEKMRNQWEDMRVSCMRLTSSLARHDEDSKKNKAIDSARQAEFVAAKVNEMRAQEQSERLTIMLQELQAVQSTLITKEAVEEQLLIISMLRVDVKKKDELHRDLISRYSTLKAAIEEAFSKVPSAGARNMTALSTLTLPGIGMLTGDNIRGAIESLLDQIKDLKATLAITESQIDSSAPQEQLYDAFAASGETFHSPWSHFEGLGVHPAIPVYLRSVGRVQNFFMSRLDTAKLTREIMNACQLAEEQRVAAEQEELAKNSIPGSGTVKSIAQPFSTFFAKYLSEKYNSASKGTEMAYNLIDCLKKYHQESDCRLFTLILDDALPADVWFNLNSTLANLLNTMKAEENRQLGHASTKKKMTIETFIRTLKKVFSSKTEQAIARVSRALALETTSNRFIDLDRCLAEHDFTWSLVSEELRQQYISETIEFYDVMTDCVDRCREMPSDTTACIPDLRTAILSADPKKARSEVNAYLTRGCGVCLEHMLIMEAKRIPVRLDTFLKRLKSGLLQKT